MSIKTHFTAELWAKNEVTRLTDELEEERAARCALETRLAVLEKEMDRDEREWHRTLRIGAALSSTASFAAAVDKGGDRACGGESNLEECHGISEAGGGSHEAGRCGESPKSKSKSNKKKEKNGGGPPGALCTGGVEGGGYTATDLPADSAVVPHLMGVFPTRPALPVVVVADAAAAAGDFS